MRPGLLALCLTLGGCLESRIEYCPDGRLCPEGTACYEGACVPPAQLAACDGAPDGDPCAFPGTPSGHCLGGLCVTAGCGDGFVEGDEQCEGVDVGVHTCQDFGFHEPGAVACDAARCLLDGTACTGDRCGDGVRNGAEACDGAELAGATCGDFGFHAGTLGCTAACTYDTAGCSEVCGDGVVNGEEECDGAAVGASCLDLGADYGPLGCTPGCRLDDAGCADLGWVQQPSGTAQELLGVWIAPTGARFAVGRGGAIVRHTGVLWTAMPSGTTKVLRAVWGSADDDVYAVGDGPTVRHFDGNAWSALDIGATDDLLAIHGTSSDDVWVVGWADVLHRDATGWSAVNTGATSTVRAVWAAAPGDVYIGTSSGEIRHLTGGAWASEANGLAFEGIAGIAGAGGKVYAVGEYGTILVRDGAAWHARRVAPTSSAQCLAAVGDDLLVCSSYRVLHGRDDKWEVLDIAPSAGFNAIAGTSIDDVLGVGVSGAIFRFAGTGPTIAPFGPLEESPGAVHGTGPEDVFFVASRGSIVHLGPAGWEKQPSGTADYLYALFALAPDLVLASSQSGIWRYDGTTWAAWPGSPVGMMRLWGSGSHVYAADSGQVFHHDGTAWSDVSQPASSYPSLWGSAPDDVYLGVYTDSVARFDGTAWTTEDTGCACGGAPSSVWGLAADDRYASQGNRVFHRDATGWTQVATAASTVYAMWGSATNDVFAVGGSGKVTHFDGNAWTAQTAGTSTINAVWGSGPDDVYALTSAYPALVMHYDGATWAPLFAPDAREDAIATGGAVIAVGPGGSIVRLDSDGWWPMTSPTIVDLHAVWSAGATAVAVGDAGTIVRFDGTRWTADAPATAQALRGVWGDDAVGDGGVRLHYNGTSWVIAASPTSSALRAIHGRFEVGDAGTILVDGAAATSPTSADLAAVWASGDADAWAVGAAGAVVHFDGTAWSLVDVGLAGDLVGVTGTAAGDVFVVSASGAAAHFDGVAWSPVRLGAVSSRGVVAGPDALYLLGDAAPQRIARLAPW